MKLNDLVALITLNENKHLQMLLPGGGEVPVAFHITEAGYVKKEFLDCGGRYHRSDVCQLQAWVGNDGDHRLAPSKLLGILTKAMGRVLPHDAGEFPVEIEYENLEVTQFRISGSEVTGDSLVLRLASRHTDCLAKEVCLPPAQAGRAAESSCCDGGKC